MDRGSLPATRLEATRQAPALRRAIIMRWIWTRRWSRRLAKVGVRAVPRRVLQSANALLALALV